MINELFSKSFQAICHPFSTLAMLVLLLNDHLLRQLWPSWWTGKLGDIAWLFVAPILFLVPLSMIFQPQGQGKRSIMTALAYGTVGLVFTLTNVLEEFNSMVIGCAEALLQMPLQMMTDPTDLLTLPVLLLSLIFFVRLKPTKSERRYRGFLLTAFGGLLTVANMAAPQYGVNKLEANDGQVIACSAYESHISNDGGLSWELDALSYAPECQEDRNADLDFDLNGLMKNYRYFADGQVIESSMDGGKTWITEFVIQPVGQAEQVLLQKSQPGNAFFEEGPLDGVYEPESGSLIFAMGLEGVLVRTADGKWSAVGVGNFKPIQGMTFSNAMTLLWGELLVGLGLFLLLFSTGSIHLKSKVIPWILLVCGWLGWLGVVLVFQPAMNDGYPIPLDLIFASLAVLILPLSGYFIFLLIRHYDTRMILSRLTNFVTALLFVLPYFLWAFNVIPEYGYAILGGLMLAGSGALLGLKVIRNIDDKSR